MPRKSGLGRGLGALIPGSETTPAAGGVSYIHVSEIIPNPRQPRSQFRPEEIEELATSIRQHGILQPLIVSYSEESGNYVLIAGERRWLAAKQAGLNTVPSIIREVSDQERLELALVENLQRTDLNPLEAAEAYRQLSEDFNLSHEQISARVGKSRAAITNTIRLLKLPLEVKKALIEEKISEGHARSLLALPTPESQIAILQTILAQNLNVRQTEALVQKLIGDKLKPLHKSTIVPELAALEEQLRAHFGTKVKLQNRSKGGGTITIHYYSDEELDVLIKTLLGDNK
jgi:ParB family chromosome partitioning protein